MTVTFIVAPVALHDPMLAGLDQMIGALHWEGRGFDNKGVAS